VEQIAVEQIVGEQIAEELLVAEQTAEERASGKLVVVTEPVAGESVRAVVGKIEVVELEGVEQTEVVGQIGVGWTVGVLLAGKGNEYVGEEDLVELGIVEPGFVEPGGPEFVVERVVGEQTVGIVEEQIC